MIIYRVTLKRLLDLQLGVEFGLVSLQALECCPVGLQLFCNLSPVHLSVPVTADTRHSMSLIQVHGLHHCAGSCNVEDYYSIFVYLSAMVFNAASSSLVKRAQLMRGCATRVQVRRHSMSLRAPSNCTEKTYTTCTDAVNTCMSLCANVNRTTSIGSTYINGWNLEEIDVVEIWRVEPLQHRIVC